MRSLVRIFFLVDIFSSFFTEQCDGHSLIAMAGVGVAIGLKAALQAHNISGKIILLGTPGQWLSDVMVENQLNDYLSS